MAKRFHELYGEFSAIWKLWNYHTARVEADDVRDARWILLERACAAEAGLEATFTELAADRELSVREIEDLGKFRQVYQQLRETIRDNRPLGWYSSEHPLYREFKDLAPRIAYTIRTGKGTRSDSATRRANAWLDVTSNRFEDFWLDPPSTASPQ